MKMGILAVGNNFALAMRQGHGVVAWGHNTQEQTDVPPGLTDVTAVAAGFETSYALRSDGTVVAWGSNARGQADVPSGLSGIEQISAGAGHAVAVDTEGRVHIWGQLGDAPAYVPADLQPVLEIASGAEYVLVLQDDGTVFGWGDPAGKPLRVPPDLGDVMYVDVGASAIPWCVAITEDRDIVMWGEDGPVRAPEMPEETAKIIGIAAGGPNFLLSHKDASVTSWPAPGATAVAAVPEHTEDVVAIAGSATHNAGLKMDGSVVGWRHDGDAVDTLSQTQDPDVRLAVSPLVARVVPGKKGACLEFQLLRRDRTYPGDQPMPSKDAIKNLIGDLELVVHKDPTDMQARARVMAQWLNLNAVLTEEEEFEMANEAVNDVVKHKAATTHEYAPDLSLINIALMYNFGVMTWRFGDYKTTEWALNLSESDFAERRKSRKKHPHAFDFVEEAITGLRAQLELVRSGPPAPGGAAGETAANAALANQAAAGQTPGEAAAGEGRGLWKRLVGGR